MLALLTLNRCRSTITNRRIDGFMLRTSSIKFILLYFCFSAKNFRSFSKDYLCFADLLFLMDICTSHFRGFYFEK